MFCPQIPANTSLLNNFEIVATSLIALVFFKEAIGKRLGIAIMLITFSSLILPVENLRFPVNNISIYTNTLQ